MAEIKVLDCTLRDGGYCNNWMFGYNNMKKIVDGLSCARVKIVECGFLSNKSKKNINQTLFDSVSSAERILPQKRDGSIYTLMINYGEYDLKSLPECDNSGITGIRYAFHKKNYKDAMVKAQTIIDKGYNLFVQPMVSLNYSEEEFLDLINLANELKPYAFYLVDSFGTMKRSDMVRLYQVIDDNLLDGIRIGFHSHNNLQLAYSNSQYLVEKNQERDLIIDTSICGMGRGAGNLNTELFIDYLNTCFEKEYDLKPILNVIDEVVSKFQEEHAWGYSLPNYLSAIHLIHPNYANYLSNFHTLTFEAMDEIFSMVEPEKGTEFDQKYIEQLYLLYMEKGNAMQNRKAEFEDTIRDLEVLIIGPGKSAASYKELIRDEMNRQGVISISVNYDYPYARTDYIFTSNLRRFRELSPKVLNKTIITTNIKTSEAYMDVDYASLLNNEEYAKDNAGMMLIRFLIQCGVKSVTLAGFDGYSKQAANNYGFEELKTITAKEFVDPMNEAIKRLLDGYKKEIEIRWLTPSIYEG